MAVVSEAGAVDCLADKFDLAMEWLLQPAQPDVVIGMCFSSRMSMNASAAAARIAANASARAAKLSSGASSLTHGAFPTSPLSPDAAAAGTVPLTRFIAAAALPPALSGGSGKAQPTGQGQGQGQGQGETSWRLSSPGGSGHVSVVGVDGQVDDGSGQLQEEAEQEDLDAGAVAPLWLQVRAWATGPVGEWLPRTVTRGVAGACATGPVGGLLPPTFTCGGLQAGSALTWGAGPVLCHDVLDASG